MFAVRTESRVPTILRERLAMETVAERRNVFSTNTNADRPAVVGLFLKREEKIVNGRVHRLDEGTPDKSALSGRQSLQLALELLQGRRLPMRREQTIKIVDAAVAEVLHEERTECVERSFLRHDPSAQRTAVKLRPHQ